MVTRREEISLTATLLKKHQRYLAAAADETLSIDIANEIGDLLVDEGVDVIVVGCGEGDLEQMVGLRIDRSKVSMEEYCVKNGCDEEKKEDKSVST